MAQKRILSWVVVFLVTVTCVSSAQDGPGEPEKIHSLRMDVDMVLVDTTVTDSSHGRPVPGLKPENFQIIEDKVVQKITAFSSEDVPVSVGIIFDISGSMKDKISNAIRAAQTFFKSGTADDEYFQIQFSDRPVIASDFTSDIGKLQGSLLSVQTKGSTALYDAVYLGLNKLKESNNPKKALLLITDGEDNRSRYSFSNVRDYIREQDVQVYAIGILDPTTGAGRDALVQMTEVTGGRAFFPYSSGEMSDICRKIAAELKNQYVLGYRSTNSAHDGSWRKIQVKIVKSKETKEAGGVDVRAKKGYYAPTGDATLVKKK